MKSILVALTMIVLVNGIMSLAAGLRFFAGKNAGDIAIGAIGLFVGAFLLFGAGGMFLDLIAVRQPAREASDVFFR
jgi:hypothetical protein